MNASLFDLNGRTALVTGGSRGIGKLIAKGLLEAGVRVYITSRKARACDETAEELGENCFSLPADVSSEAGAAELAAQYGQAESHLDILINNAGAVWVADFEAVDEKSWDKVFDINLKAPFFVTQKLHPFLKQAVQVSRVPAKVIIIGSIDAIALSALEVYAYHGSKAGIVYLARRMAARLIKDNIIVNSISPGAFASDMNKMARDNPQRSAAAIPAGRIG